MTKSQRQILVDAAMGRAICDTKITNAQIINVFTKEILNGSVFIKDQFIVDVDYKGDSICFAKKTIDLEGKYLAPGFIDTHLHIESSMLTPRNFVKAVLPFGTTTLITDPHELANTMGIEGVKYVLENTKDLPINYYVLVPSCVPSVEFKENSGAIFYAPEVESLLKEDRVLGIGEIMDYIGVINNASRMVDIINSGYESNTFLQGHIPGGRGNILSAYLCGGPVSCHESWLADEALEKLRKGMWVDGRESSLIKNIREIVRALPDKENPPFNLSFCTDDKEADDILEVGHINNVVREAIDEGMNPIAAICCATINAAREIGLKYHGAIAPNFFADLIVLEDLKDIDVLMVFYQGQKVAENGSLSIEISEMQLPIEKENTIIVDNILLERFYLKSNKNEVLVNIMDFEDEMSLIAYKKQDTLPVINGIVSLDDHPQYNFVAVINRYKNNNNIALGIVEKFHINGGAIASSVGHDCHNITVVFNNPKDAYLTVQRLKQIHGGCVAIKDEKILGELELSIAGLISPLPVKELSEQIKQYNQVLKRFFGITHSSPIMRSFFIALAVIPYVKMTDMGLIDVITQEFIPTIIE